MTWLSSTAGRQPAYSTSRVVVSEELPATNIVPTTPYKLFTSGGDTSLFLPLENSLAPAASFAGGIATSSFDEISPIAFEPAAMNADTLKSTRRLQFEGKEEAMHGDDFDGYLQHVLTTACGLSGTYPPDRALLDDLETLLHTAILDEARNAKILAVKSEDAKNILDGIQTVRSDSLPSLIWSHEPFPFFSGSITPHLTTSFVAMLPISS